jgi:hypothetical protein
MAPRRDFERAAKQVKIRKEGSKTVSAEIIKPTPGISPRKYRARQYEAVAKKLWAFSYTPGMTMIPAPGQAAQPQKDPGSLQTKAGMKRKRRKPKRPGA